MLLAIICHDCTHSSIFNAQKIKDIELAAKCHNFVHFKCEKCTATIAIARQDPTEKDSANDSIKS